ncbi:hypothetical protein A3SI_17409 [Nitritalea halalkaliphila LW7]|uniref:ABC3 transporter permease C-terminal domain-containing protein n=2 Tax=Nitritalea TaxID=1187887 RepID=I5BVU5_9BACT|nr:hypothetical protein A3SI_17409 [Nitritalea halalkaliphila LW7]
MLMAVFERTREIGMLMAIGMRRSKVFLLITLETFFLSLSGALIGLAIGFAWVLHLSRRGLDLSRFHDVMRELGVDSVIFPTLSPEMPYLILGIVMLTALFAALYPALKALALSPIEAIRK